MTPDSFVKYCPVCGQPASRKRVHGRDRPVCPSCGYIHFQEPKVAAGILVLQDDRVLLVRRSMQPQRGMWTLPAGFVDADEDPAGAAIREVLEETGLVVEIEGLLDVMRRRRRMITRGLNWMKLKILVATMMTFLPMTLQEGNGVIKVSTIIRWLTAKRLMP